MSDDEEVEGEDEGEEDSSSELTMMDGEVWFHDADALCEQFGIVGFSVCDGGVIAFVPGEGGVELGAFLKKKRALQAVT